MIRVALISKHYASFAKTISEFLESQNIEFVLSNYRHQSIQDLYFIEIEKNENRKKSTQKRTHFIVYEENITRISDNDHALLVWEITP